MSEIAGRMSVVERAKYLETTYGGRGILFAGVPGVENGKVVILGGGTVGTEACKTAIGLGADVTVIDIIYPQAIRDIFPSITNQLVLLIFGTSVLSILDVKELTQAASILNSQSFRSMEIFSYVMFLYYGITTLTLTICRLIYK
jgi:ABC-type arginine/histidine transport system permease subunit